MNFGKEFGIRLGTLIDFRKKRYQRRDLLQNKLTNLNALLRLTKNQAEWDRIKQDILSIEEEIKALDEDIAEADKAFNEMSNRGIYEGRF